MMQSSRKAVPDRDGRVDKRTDARTELNLLDPLVEPMVQTNLLSI